MQNLTSKVAKKFEAWERQQFFAHKCIDESSSTCNPIDYFRETSHFIDMTQLYKVVSTCYNNDEMKYMPILVEVKQPQVRAFLGGSQYLLQVWDVTTNKKIYQLPLQQPIHKWASCYDYVVFTLKDGNQDSDALHIVNLAEENKTLKVKNFVRFDHISYYQRIIYISQGSSISAIFLEEKHLSQEEVDLEALTKHTFDTETHIWGMIQLNSENNLPILILESPDNQIDFNVLQVTGSDSLNDEGFDYKLYQVREKVQRKRFIHDNIQQVEVIINNGLVYAFSLRESSSFDLYFDMKRTESTNTYKIKELVSNIKGFLFQTEDGTHYNLYHKGEKSLSFANICQIYEYMNLDPLDLSITHVETIKNNVRFFSSVAMVNETQQVLFAHESYLSFYNIAEDKFVGHIDVGSNILSLFELDISRSRYHCMLLQNGETKKIDFSNLGDNHLPTCTEDVVEQVEEKILSVANDKTYSYPVYILTEDEDNYKTVKAIIQEGDLIDIRLQGDIGDVFNMIPFSCSRRSYLLVQMNKALYVYEQKGTVESDFKLLLQMNHGEQDIDGNINSIATKDPERHLILFDEKNGYIIKQNPFSFTKVERLFVSYLLQEDKHKGFYALKGNDNDKNDEGYFFLDVDATVDKQKVCFIPIVIFDIKPENVIYKGFQNSRFGFFQSLYAFVISIIPNKNMNLFYDGISKDNYVVYKQIKDMCVVLDDQDYLITWDIVTGKRINKFKSNVSMKGFYQYNDRGYQTTLFRKQYDGSDMNLSDFLEEWQLNTYTKNQVSYRQNFTDVTFYVFREVEVINEKTMKIHMEYIFPISSNVRVNLISNSKKDLLIARDDQGWSCLFRVIPQADSARVKLQMVRTIQEFPYDLHYFYRYRLDFFTPEFTKFIGYNRDTHLYQVYDTFTGKKLADVPKDLMVKTQDLIRAQMVINRFEWIDERVFRIASADGLEKLIDVEDNFKEISFNQIPLFNQIDGNEWKDGEYHIYKSRQAISDPIKKFKRIYQDFKSRQFLFKNTPRSHFNQLLFCQDFESFDHFNHSFTLLNWNIAFSIQEGNLSFKDVSESLIEASLYAVFPGGNTILHSLADRPDELEILLNSCHPNAKTIKYHVPIILNGLQESVLSIAVAKNAFKTANNLLKHLSLYPADHHSRAIQAVYPQLIKLKLPDFDTYMESRLIVNPQLSVMTKLKLVEEYEEIQVSTPWLNEENFHEANYDCDQPEKKVKLEILDVAGVYHYNDPDEDRFFDALAQTDQFAYFELRSIQKLIDFNYPIVQKYLIRKLFIPYCFFLGIYNFLVFTLYDNKHQETYEIFYWITLAITVVFASYFMLNELRQMRNDGLEYFKSIWNYLDTLPLFGIYVILSFALIEEFGFAEKEFNKTIERSFVSVVTLLMWLKFLYFFRLFDATSYLIRAIVEVVFSMRHFLLVLLFTIIGFGNAFFVIANGNDVNSDPEVDNFFITSYLDSILFSYRMVLGDFDTTGFGELAVPLCIILFLLFTIFNMIVMLNLLIAIISDAYAAVAELAEQAKYQERATMIAENNYLIPDDVKQAYAPQGQLLLIVTDLEKEEKPKGEDAIIQKIDELRDNVQSEINGLKSDNKSSIEGIKESVDQLQLFLLSQMPKDIINTKLSSFEVEKMTLFQVQGLHEKGEYNEWTCDGQNFNGCYNDDEEDGVINNDDTVMYRCAKCCYDICEDCYDNYGEPHIHPLEKITLRELKVIDPRYEEGFGCDARYFEGCKNQGKRFNQKFSILYHNAEHKFNLCESCVGVYKISPQEAEQEDE